MIKWPEISAFRNVVKSVRHYTRKHNTDETVVYPTLLFRGTIKLHGTNAGISRTNGIYNAQSRERVLTIDKDNYGFAMWLANSLQNPEFKRQLDIMFDAVDATPTSTVTIFGEWAGGSVQKNVALNQLQEPHWFIFGAHVSHLPYNSTELFGDNDDPTVITDNSYFVPNSSRFKIDNPRVHNILDYPIFFVSVDFNIPEQSLETITNLTLNVENECPVGLAFGASGIGEGIVWTCVERPDIPDLIFKSKGSKHSGKSETTKKVATIEPEVLTKMNELVDYVASVERLTQGLQIVSEVTMENMWSYIKWVSQDILKEESDTIAASGFEWKQLVKRITDVAKVFYISQVNSNY